MNHTPAREQLTTENLARLAGKEHTRLIAARGIAVHSATAFARAKAKELLNTDAALLERLIERDTARRAAGLDPIPNSVLVAAALGDDHSLAHYPAPEPETADVA